MIGKLFFSRSKGKNFYRTFNIMQHRDFIKTAALSAVAVSATGFIRFKKYKIF
jgi:hypothetical protein